MYNGDNPIVFSARDPTNHSSCRRCPGRTSRAGEGDSGIGDNSGEEGSGSNESNIKEHLVDGWQRRADARQTSHHQALERREKWSGGG